MIKGIGTGYSLKYKTISVDIYGYCLYTYFAQIRAQAALMVTQSQN